MELVTDENSTKNQLLSFLLISLHVNGRCELVLKIGISYLFPEFSKVEFFMGGNCVFFHVCKDINLIIQYKNKRTKNLSKLVWPTEKDYMYLREICRERCYGQQAFVNICFGYGHSSCSCSLLFKHYHGSILRRNIVW